MSNETRELISWALGTLIAVCFLVGLGVRFVLVPYLREHLIQPMKQVQKQVTENHHHNTEPTVLDRIDDVQKAMDETRVDIKIIKDSFKGHTDWSQGWVAQIEADIEQLRRRRRWLW